MYLSFHTYPKFPEMLEIYAHRKINFQHYRQIKISRIIWFRSEYVNKMAQNIVPEGRNLWWSKIIAVFVKN